MQPTRRASALVVCFASAIARAGDAPSSEALANARYHGLQGVAGPVRLIDGRWEGEPFVPGGASRPGVSMLSDFRRTGDLDGDGAPEAVVVLVESSGGSGSYVYIAAVARRNGETQNVATRLLGDRVKIQKADIEDGVLRLTALKAGEDDAMCCPTEAVEYAFTLRNGRFLTAGEAGGEAGPGVPEGRESAGPE